MRQSFATPAGGTGGELAARHDVLLSNGFSAAAIGRSVIHRLPVVFIHFNYCRFPPASGHPRRLFGNWLRTLYLHKGIGHVCTATWVRDQLARLGRW